MSLDIFEMRVSRVSNETDDIKCFELRMLDGGPVPAFTAGAHIDIHMDGFARQYSISNDPKETHRYVLGVLREPESRGGSIWVHNSIGEGTVLRISGPRNNFPLSADAQHHVLIGGGIGVTPVLSMAWELVNEGKSFEMHYCAKARNTAAFADVLDRSPIAEHLTYHFDGGDPAKGYDLKSAFADVRPGTHVYCCGPAGLLAAAKAATSHWPQGTFHFESFTVLETDDDADNESFEVEIASSGAVFKIGPDQTIAEVLRDGGVEVDTLCEDGICGTCITDVLEGVPDHRDSVLDDDERASNELITVCCSRSKSKRLKLDL